MSREEMDQLSGSDPFYDIVLVTGDAYVDRPSFGMAICGRMLEAQGFRVGIIASQTGAAKTISCVWVNRICFSVFFWRHRSMINRYTANRRLRHDDAYTPDNVAGKRRIAPHWFIPRRCKEGVERCTGHPEQYEASLRRTAHYDYSSEEIPCAVPCWSIRKPTC
ncbi:hypothetical protein ACNKHR_17710 [Shigella flexneri]